MNNEKYNAFDSLRNIRDTEPISSRNTSAGSLLQEAFTLFKSIEYPIDVPSLRHNALVENNLHKTTWETRRKTWEALYYRYLEICPEWVGASLIKASGKGINSSDFVSLSYLYYIIRYRLVFDFVTGPIWEKWQQQTTTITARDFLEFLEQKASKSPHMKKWRESTKKKLASNTLSALRDFGLLKGIQKKTILRPPVSNETVFHLLCILKAEGKEGAEIVSAPDRRLFLWSETDVANGLQKLAQMKWIKFEKSTKTVILQLIRTPEVSYE